MLGSVPTNLAVVVVGACKQLNELMSVLKSLDIKLFSYPDAQSALERIDQLNQNGLHTVVLWEYKSTRTTLKEADSLLHAHQCKVVVPLCRSEIRVESADHQPVGVSADDECTHCSFPCVKNAEGGD